MLVTQQLDPDPDTSLDLLTASHLLSSASVELCSVVIGHLHAESVSISAWAFMEFLPKDGPLKAPIFTKKSSTIHYYSNFTFELFMPCAIRANFQRSTLFFLVSTFDPLVINTALSFLFLDRTVVFFHSPSLFLPHKNCKGKNKR